MAGALIFPWRSPPRIIGTVQLTNDGRVKDFYHLATDGSRVYFSEDLGQGAGFEFAQVPTTGGDSNLAPGTFLEEQGQGALYDVSRSRNELLVGRSEHANFAFWGRGDEEPTLWVMSVLGGLGRRLGDLRARSACWSPDGQRIAYASDRDLYIARSDGTESHKLLPAPLDSTPLFLSWSPDGSRLRFTNGALVGLSLWEVSADGTNLHPLLPGWSNKAQWGGRWTPDGRYYVFLVNSLGISPDIWAIRETRNFLGKAEREPMQLTFGPMFFGPPVLSPDGKRLFAMGSQPRGELVRYDVTSGHWVPFFSGMSATHLDFSRDGKWVTYVTSPGGPLWRSRVDGSQRLQLTPPGMWVKLPRWSPDGKQIAFYGHISRPPFQIFVVSAEGGNVEQVVHRNCPDLDPGWSPDGNRLVFSPAEDSSCAAAIYVFDLKSRQLSTIPGSDGLAYPRWSPDGNSIVAIAAGRAKLMLFNFATQRWEEIFEGSISYPGWSHDGRFVYFMNNTDVLRVRIADHKVEKVASLTGLPLKYQSGLDLAPDDSPLVLRDTTVRELYALDWVAP